MPHSLRVRLSALRYKKIISDKDYDRLCKALDNENVLNFLFNVINPNEMEQYMQMYKSKGEKIEHIGDTHETNN